MAAGDKIVIAAQGAGFYGASGNISKGTGDTISLPEGLINIGGNGKGYAMQAQASFNPLTAGNNDGSFAAFAVGQNYYIYACQQASGIAKIIVSINSTYPTGYTASNSRKIGGFHYGRVRNSITVADVTNGAVVHNSVWDLINRPICSPDGMAYNGNGAWVDIYKPSIGEALAFANGSGSPLTAGTAKSAYNAVPLTGTEGLNGYNWLELARMSGKRLLSKGERLQAAHGSPQGNNADNVNAWSMTTNTGRANTGSVVNAISLLNIVDCVGNVWEWLDEFLVRWDDTGAAGQIWGWKDPMAGMGVGQLNMIDEQALVQVIAGGPWDHGVYTGSRCVRLSFYPWLVGTDIGSRFACDSL